MIRLNVSTGKTCFTRRDILWTTFFYLLFKFCVDVYKKFTLKNTPSSPKVAVNTLLKVHENLTYTILNDINNIIKTFLLTYLFF